MTKIIEAYAPWRLDVLTYRNMLVQPRIQGYRKHPILHNEWAYIDVAPKGGGVAPAGAGKGAPD
jgi:oligopeptide transport system substrate-binding protein